MTKATKPRAQNRQDAPKKGKQVPPPAVGGEVAAAPIIFFSLYICVLMAVAVTAAVTETVTAAVTVTVAATVLTVSLSLRQS